MLLSVFVWSSLKKQRNMSRSSNIAACCRYLLVLMMLLLVISALAQGLRVNPTHYMEGKATKVEDEGYIHSEGGWKEEVGMGLYPSGSSLPDCSHACGPCFPCKRVMVSFKCSIAESCPIVYRCMCKGRYYHVPSN